MIGIAFLFCILFFLFGYLRGLYDLQTIQNWGIGFDQGWEAAVKFTSGQKEEKEE